GGAGRPLGAAGGPVGADGRGAGAVAEGRGGGAAVTTEDAFIAAILEAPDDPAPRLILADWLEEYGDEGQRRHAELIRVQVELAAPWDCEWEKQDGAACPQYNARRPPYRLQVYCPTCARRERLRARSRELANVVTAPNAVFGACQEWHYRRGFVETVVIDLNVWLKEAEALLVAAPIRRVLLTPCGAKRQVRTDWVSYPNAVNALQSTLLGRPGMSVRIPGPEVALWGYGEIVDAAVFRMLHAEWPTVEFRPWKEGGVAVLTLA